MFKETEQEMKLQLSSINAQNEVISGDMMDKLYLFLYIGLWKNVFL